MKQIKYRSVENNSTRIYSIPFSLQPPNSISATKLDPKQIDSSTSRSNQLDHCKNCSPSAQLVHSDHPVVHDYSRHSNQIQINQHNHQLSNKKTKSNSNLYSDPVTEQIAISALNQLKQK
jgi:hypothetical protein